MLQLLDKLLIIQENYNKKINTFTKEDWTLSSV